MLFQPTTVTAPACLPSLGADDHLLAEGVVDIGDHLVQPAVPSDAIIEKQYGILDHRPLLHMTPGKRMEWRTVPSMTAAIIDQTVVHRGVIANQHRLKVADAAMIEVGPQPPFFHVDERLLSQQVHIGLPVLLDGPGVAPVAAELVAVHPTAFLHQHRDDVPAELKGGILLIFVQKPIQHLGFEAEDRQRGPVGLRLDAVFPNRP